MAEFSSLNNNDPTIPLNPSSNPYGLPLTNPDNVLSGQNRGTQSIGGSANIQSDPTNQRIVVNDNTNNRVAFGRIGTGVNDWGLKVSKPGYDVGNATNDQLIFNSSQNVFKIVQTGSVTIPSCTVTTAATSYGSNAAAASITHNLGYVPILLAFINDGGSGNYILLPDQLFAQGASQFALAWYRGFSTTTTASFEIDMLAYNYVAGYTVSSQSVKYYLLQESAS